MATYEIHDVQLKIQTNRMGIRFLRPLMNEVEREARVLASTGHYQTGSVWRTAPSLRPLRASFYQIAPHPDVRGVSGRVGNRAPHARMVHNGTRAHPIPIVGETYQRFKWRRVGHMVVMYYVDHPGQKGKFFLSKALASVGLTHRLRFILYNVRSTIT